MQQLARCGSDRQQRVISALSAAGDLRRAMLRQSIRLAQGRVEVDGQRIVARTGAGAPGTAQRLAADRVELAGMAPGEGAQEGAQGRSRRWARVAGSSSPASATRRCSSNSVVWRSRVCEDRIEQVSSD